MRILLSCPNDSQTNNYIINALQDLGHDVAFIDHRRFLKEAAEAVPQFFKNWDVDLFLVLYLVPGLTYPAEYIRELKSKFPHVQYAAWVLDTRISTLLDSLQKSQLLFCNENKDFINIVRQYDYFFTIVKGQIESFRQQNVNAFYLPEGFDHYTPRFQFQEQPIDVSFMGQTGKSIFPQRYALLKKIFQQYPNGRIYGAIDEDSEFVRVSMGRNTFNDTEHSRVVGKTKVNIGHCEWPNLLRSFSARAYRIMGAGGFFMMNSGAHIDGMFKIGEELITYDSHKDCLDKIAYYIANEEERRSIAAAGQKRVLQDYTFVNSMKRIFEIIA